MRMCKYSYKTPSRIFNSFNMTFEQRLDSQLRDLRKLQQDIEFYIQMQNIIKKFQKLKL